VARGGKGGHTPHRQPSRPHAGDRRLGSVSNPRFRAAVKAAKTPITREEFSSLLGIVSGLKFGRVTGMAKGGAASIGRGGGGGGGGGGRATKGVRLSEFIKERSKAGGVPSRTSFPKERGLGLRSEVNRKKASIKTQKAIMKSEDRIFLHTSGEKRMSPTKLRREGRLQRNLSNRLEEINPIRPRRTPR